MSLYSRPTMCGSSFSVFPWGLTLALLALPELKQPVLSAKSVATGLFHKHLFHWHREDECTGESRLLLDFDHAHNITTPSIKQCKCLRKICFFSHPMSYLSGGVSFSVVVFSVALIMFCKQTCSCCCNVQFTICSDCRMQSSKIYCSDDNCSLDCYYFSSKIGCIITVQMKHGIIIIQMFNLFWWWLNY